MESGSPIEGSDSGPQRKALEINLDPSQYGTFAEIGAGQEVADWFLRVGGASGTVAQTICAYDKAFSDERYGRGTRYVSRERLLAMLEREYQSLEQQLRGPRGPDVRFFAFADTIAARSFKGDNEQHGWVGLRFQATSGAAPSDILLHVALRDRTVEQQRSALGVLGVNLVHAAFHQKAEGGAFLAAVFEGLSTERMELDVVELGGPFFAGQDARLWCLEALRGGMARALLFDRTGRPEQPSTLLRKRNLVVEGQSSDAEHLDPPTLVSAAFEELHREGSGEQEPMLLLETRLEQLASSGGPGSVAERLGLLTTRAPVIVTDQRVLHPVVEYLRRYTTGPIRMVTDVATFARLLSGSYETLPGTLLESLGKLLVENVRLYIYPVPRETFQRTREARVGASPSGANVTLDDLRCEPPLDHLLRYLRGAGWLVPLEPR
ncbi:MAG: hypothetical protein EHM78_25050 [Myxococcaceae bacterium]|nr:MAG: hypothetical protein EHM78_25050 [Myxococcaceae bacterium]